MRRGLLQHRRPHPPTIAHIHRSRRSASSLPPRPVATEARRAMHQPGQDGMGDAALLAAVTVAEAARYLLPPAQTACCAEPDVQHGLYCGVQLEEPTCMGCGEVAPPPPLALLPEPAAIALAAAIASLRPRVGVGGAPEGEGDDVNLGDDAQAAVTGSDTSGFVGMDGRNTYLCDGFLYSQRDQDALEEAGQLRCCYCPSCGALYPTGTERCHRRRGGVGEDADAECGGEVKPRRWVTNSLPLHQILHIFTGLLPATGVSSADLRGKTVADIGSRLGNNILVAALLTEAHAAIGIEVNPTIAALSKELIAESAVLTHAQAALFEPESRTTLSVLCSDVRAPLALQQLRDADVAIFFNPFELHTTREEHADLLRLMASTIRKPGARVVTCPSMAEIWGRAGAEPEVLDGWLRLLASEDDVHAFEVLPEPGKK